MMGTVMSLSHQLQLDHSVERYLGISTAIPGTSYKKVWICLTIQYTGLHQPML